MQHTLGLRAAAHPIRLLLTLAAAAVLGTAGNLRAETTWAEITGGEVSVIEADSKIWNVHIFDQPGVNSLEVLEAGEIEILMVGGGGGGGQGGSLYGGGGGAGGMVVTSRSISSGTHELFIGGGGNAGQQGEDSTFLDVVALGGARGGTANTTYSGGSGGGASHRTNTSGDMIGGSALQPGSPSGGYGHKGGDRSSLSVPWGAGGGGAGGPGQDNGDGLAGGSGMTSDFSGLSLEYARGGEGGSESTFGQDGRAAKGDGGSGGRSNDEHFAGSGGSGVIIVRYVIAEVAMSAPTNLTATPLGSDQVDLAWTDNSPEATHFIIERSPTPGSGFELLTTVSAGVTSYADTDVSISNTWYYRVIATDGEVESLPSLEATVTIPKLPATVTLGNLQQIFSGSPHAVSVTTDPAGLDVLVTYDGSETPPLQLGSYEVIASVVSDTYEGTASGTLVVSMLAPSVEIIHPSMDQQLGYPAIIQPGAVLPSLQIEPTSGGTLEAQLYNSETGALVESITPRALTTGVAETVNFSGGLTTEGVYRIDLRIVQAGGAVGYYDSYYFSVIDLAALPANYSQAAHPGPDGLMRYVPDVRGNRVPDFSGVGYLGGEEIPHVPTALVLEPEPGDATQRIQDAIDTISEFEPNADGFRGAVELAAGLYEIAGTLHIEQSGVVLRGAGTGDLETFTLNPADDLNLAQWLDSMSGTSQTILVGTGPDHRQLLTIAGSSGIEVEEATATEILDTYVPVGRNWFHVANPEFFAVGDTIQLERRGNADWISEIKMDQIPPRPDGGATIQWTPFSLFFEYTIRSIDGNRITVDSGLVTAVELEWGGGLIQRYNEGGRIRFSGVENLRAVSFWQIDAGGKDDTAHVDRFVLFDRMRDGWARNIAAEHFTPNVAGMFRTGRDSLAITIENSSALAAPTNFYSWPEYDSSGRYHQDTGVYVGRYGFHFQGQKGLVRNCYAINSRHAFVLGARVAGPNVFSDSQADQSLTYSEPHHRWAVGGLYDNVQESDAIALMNRLRYGTGHGWAGANFVAWNTRGGLVCEQPPTAQNWAIGHVGTKENGPFHSWNLSNYGWSYGYWESHNQHVVPQSLYTQQIEDLSALDRIRLTNNSATTRAVLPNSTLMLDISADIGLNIAAEDVTYQWQSVSGPGNPIFLHPNQPNTRVVLDVPGEYQVELIAQGPTPESDATIGLTLELTTPPPMIDSEGGTVELVEIDGQNYRIHSFTEVGSHAFEVTSGSGEIDVLVVAGGGGGAGSSNNHWGGGGGGAGGVIETTIPITSGAIPIQVGDGGAGAVGVGEFSGQGESSVFGDLIAIGGGNARGQNQTGDGGSGGGGAPISSDSFVPYRGLALQPDSPSGGYGHPGGLGTLDIGTNRAGAGGGGAGAPGSDAAPGQGGHGGAGHGTAISGTWTYYGGGGGGSGQSSAGSGGIGGGGDGGRNTDGSPGAPNTGGGGGASSLGDPHQGGDGGSGIVIVRVPVPAEQGSTPQSSSTRVTMSWPAHASSPQLSWVPQPNASYVLQVSDDLESWHNANEVFHANEAAAEILHSIQVLEAPRQFYRLVEISPKTD